MRKRIQLASLIIALVLVFSAFNSPAAAEATWQAKVDPWVLATAGQSETEFLVFLSEQADLSGAAGLDSKLEKGAYVFERLTEVARRTQGPVLEALVERGATYRPYWIANMIWVRGDQRLLTEIARRRDVAKVYANPSVRSEQVQSQSGPAGSPAERTSPQSIEWNIAQVNAELVWQAGIDGQGVVIGGQDTGYDWDHPALKDQYRGWNGSSADHNYHWHDAIHTGGGSCGPDSPVPCDDSKHGTHTMGTIVGDDGGNNQIGMAPGARWIGCRNMNQGWGSPATYAECYQWFVAPTDLSGNNPRPDLAPHVINNSWGCPPDEGCTDPNVLLQAVENVRAAGIVTVHSAGNDGRNGCSTINTPAAIYEGSFTVGATDSSNNIASFSSRGPVLLDGSARLKPNVTAPGVGIRSSVPGGGYESGWSGTSMAGPHVAGQVALLIAQEPELAGQVEAIESLIEQSAMVRTTALDCGGTSGQSPNNVFGYGRIDAWASYQANLHQLSISNRASASAVAPGSLLTYTLTVTHDHFSAPTQNVVIRDEIPAGVTFVSATQPYQLTGNTVQWEFSSQAAQTSLVVQLVVRVDELVGAATVVNSNYSAQSDDVASVSGAPVSVIVARHQSYLPLVP